MKTPDTDRVGVIGGGLGGLAAACTLAARGYAVTLLERNAWLGGKAARLEDQGFRFDMGPTILTLPSVLARIFAEAKRELRDYLLLRPLDPQWRAFYPDGSTLDLIADTNRMAAALEAKLPYANAGDGYREFMQFAERLHRISRRYFFWRSIDSLWDTIDVRSTFTLSVLSDLLHMRLGQTVSGSVRAYVNQPQVAQLLDHFTQYVGSAPDASPAVLCGIAHMQTQEGVWYPAGGTRAIPNALVQLASSLNVDLRTNVGVRRIVVEDGAVQGIETERGELMSFAAVVSNADAVRTYQQLLDGARPRRFGRRRYEPACSGVVLYLGLRQAYDHLLHHNFVFSQDPEEEFTQIYRDGEPASDPTCYVCAPARTDATVAPPGGEALYILVHTPYLRAHHDWSALFPAYRETIFRKLADTAGLGDLAERIIYEHALTPQDIHARYGVLQGAIYGVASHGRFLGAFKPGNRSPSVRGLYLAGGAAHPGPGMPMVLMSGWIAADALDHDGLVKPQRRAANEPCLVQPAIHDMPVAVEH
jgi:diapolycopene oxygenase